MNRTQSFIQYFLSHRNVTNELIQKIDPENVDYQPTPTSMTAQTLVTHMLSSFYSFASSAKYGEGASLDTEETDLDKLANLYTAETQKLLENLTEEDFDKTIDRTNSTMGMKMTVSQFLQMAMDHEINHKGNLFIYVREMGNTDLPLFIQPGS